MHVVHNTHLQGHYVLVYQYYNRVNSIRLEHEFSFQVVFYNIKLHI